MSFYVEIFFVFSTTFALMQLLSRSSFGNLFGRKIEQIAMHTFPEYSLANFNLYGLLRIAFALILLKRSWSGFSLLIPSETFNLVGITYILELVAASMLLLGIGTQFVLLFFIGFMWQIGERITLTGTLGNDIAAILSLFLIFSQSGKYLSVDKIILTTKPKLHSWFLYQEGYKNHKSMSSIKLACLFCYWLICCYSLAMHLDEPGWMTGVTAPQLLASTFMSPHHQFFIPLFESSSFFVLMSKAGMFIMLLWYPAVLPFVILGGKWKFFVVTWGILFFTLSTFFLGLGSLGEIEFLFWIALFWPVAWGVTGSKSTWIFYDDKCNLCDGTLKFFSRIDIFSVLEPKPASMNKKLLANYGISYEKAMEDLYAVDTKTNKIVSGYDMYFFLTKRLVLFSFLFPIFLIGYSFQLGPKIYSFIALRRKKLFGICEIPSTKTDYLKNAKIAEVHPLETGTLMHITFLGIFYFLAIPIVSPIENKMSSLVPSSLRASAHVYGIAPINVFNKTDLEMSENWFVLRNEKGEILPLTRENGSRDILHKSDRIYFGHTLRFRREVIGTKQCSFEEQKSRVLYLAKVLEQYSGNEIKNFTYTQYYQKLPEFDLIQYHNKFVLSPIEIRCEINFSL